MGLLAGLYSLWAIIGAGRDASFWGAALFALGAPVYWLMRRGTVSVRRSATGE